MEALRPNRDAVWKTRAAGRYSVAFDGRGLATGLYFARLEAGPEVKVQKLMLVK